MTTSTTNATIDRTQFDRDWEDWHRAHEAYRADPHGFLAITGLYWLGPDEIAIPGVPGRWRTGESGPTVELVPGEELTIDGETAGSARAFGPIAERGGVTVGFDGGVVEVARRGGRDILRPRRPDFPYLGDYPGTPTYAPDPQWRTTATFVAYSTPRAYEVGAAVDGLTHVYDSPGYLEFALRGETFRLVAFPGHVPGTLTVLFTDATSGLTTYAANRTLSVDRPDAEGRTIVDFNRAVNLPCAYTDFATCPLPPTENRLPIGIEAGEKTPLARVHGVASALGIVPSATA